MTASVTVQHDTAQHRFLVSLQGHEAYLSYRLAGGEIDLYHTYVPEAFRGRGMAEQLCRAAFEYAKANRLTVVPTCPYISSTYLTRHPEYRSLTKSGGSASTPATR